MSLNPAGSRLGAELSRTWTCLSLKMISPSDLEQGRFETKATTLAPGAYTGARQDCGRSVAQAPGLQACCGDSRAWASSADLGRSVRHFRASRP